METEKTELEKAVELVEKDGRIVVQIPSVVAGHDPIRELCELLDGSGYKVTSARLDRDKGQKWYGEIDLTVLAIKRFEWAVKES